MVSSGADSYACPQCRQSQESESAWWLTDSAAATGAADAGRASGLRTAGERPPLALEPAHRRHLADLLVSLPALVLALPERFEPRTRAIARARAATAASSRASPTGAIS